MITPPVAAYYAQLLHHPSLGDVNAPPRMHLQCCFSGHALPHCSSTPPAAHAACNTHAPLLLHQHMCCTCRLSPCMMAADTHRNLRIAHSACVHVLHRRSSSATGVHSSFNRWRSSFHARAYSCRAGSKHDSWQTLLRKPLSPLALVGTNRAANPLPRTHCSRLMGMDTIIFYKAASSRSRRNQGTQSFASPTPTPTSLSSNVQCCVC